MDDIMKIIKSFEEAGLLIKSVNETIESETKNRNVDFLGRYVRKYGSMKRSNTNKSK